MIQTFSSNIFWTFCEIDDNFACWKEGGVKEAKSWGQVHKCNLITPNWTKDKAAQKEHPIMGKRKRVFDGSIYGSSYV